MAAYQAAISVVGQNIANVGNPNYTRQSGRLSAMSGGYAGSAGVAPGLGVRLSDLQRHIDEALEGRLRTALAARSAAETAYQALAQTEAANNELTDQDLSTNLGELFNSFSTLQTAPKDLGNRNLVLSAADGAIRTFQRLRTGLVQQVRDLNAAAMAQVSRATEIASEIGSLNRQVVEIESDGQSVAGPLRDRRDALLRELSGFMNIQTREQASGAVNVYVGSEPLVEYSRSRGLKTEIVLEGGLEIATVRFADNNGTVLVREGALGGLVTARDTHLRGQLIRLDTLARGLVYEVNRVHSTGVGLEGYTRLSGAFNVDDPTAALNSPEANLTYPVQNGTFIVHVRDKASGEMLTRQIEVDLDGLGSDTTLQELAAALDTVPALDATVTADGRLEIQSIDGKEFWFSEDSSGALAALGVGALLVGEDAATINLDSQLRGNAKLLAASLSGGLNDGENAGRLGLVGESGSGLLGGLSVQDYHATSVSQLAVETAAALTRYEAADAVQLALQAQRESISGVSLDEEAINLTTYERAFQGASRYLGAVNQLADEVLALV